MSKPSPARYRTTNWSIHTTSPKNPRSLLTWLDRKAISAAVTPPSVGLSTSRTPYRSLSPWISKLIARLTQELAQKMKASGRMPTPDQQQANQIVLGSEFVVRRMNSIASLRAGYLASAKLDVRKPN